VSTETLDCHKLLPQEYNTRTTEHVPVR